MMMKQIHPPYKPKVKAGAMDTENFDRTFTTEVVVDTPVNPSTLDVVTESFDQFTFDASAAHRHDLVGSKKPGEGFEDEDEDD